MTRRQRREAVKEWQINVNARLQMLDERLSMLEHRTESIELWEHVPLDKKEWMKHEVVRQAERVEAIRGHQILWIFEVRFYLEVISIRQ